MMEKLCCISVTLASRFIAAFDLSTSILAINFIAREFFKDEKSSITFDRIQIFFGFTSSNNNRNTLTDLQQNVNHNWFLGCLMVYSAIHLICSAGLILATIFRKKNYAKPWLIFEIISFGIQASNLISEILENLCKNVNEISDPVYVPLASLYFLLSMYFWLVVFTAQKSWANETSSGGFSKPKKSNSIDLNSPKISRSNQLASSENHSIFESPEPPISAKYYEL